MTISTQGIVGPKGFNYPLLRVVGGKVYNLGDELAKRVQVEKVFIPTDPPSVFTKVKVQNHPNLLGGDYNLWGTLHFEDGSCRGILDATYGRDELDFGYQLDFDPLVRRVVDDEYEGSNYIDVSSGPVPSPHSDLMYRAGGHRSVSIDNKVCSWVEGEGVDTRFAFVIAQRSDYNPPEGEMEKMRGTDPASRTWYQHGLDFREDLGVIPIKPFVVPAYNYFPGIGLTDFRSSNKEEHHYE